MHIHDAQDMMENIREKIRRRQPDGADVSGVRRETVCSPEDDRTGDAGVADLDRIPLPDRSKDRVIRDCRSEADRQFDTAMGCPVDSDRFGLLGSLAKRIVRKIIWFYIAVQRDFNALIVRILNTVCQKLDDTVAVVDRLVDRTNRLTEMMREQVEGSERQEHERRLSEMERRADELGKAQEVLGQEQETLRQELATREEALSEGIHSVERRVEETASRQEVLGREQETLRQELESRVAEYTEMHSEAVYGLGEQLEGLGGTIRALDERLERMDGEIQKQTFVDPKYFVFEDRFRGSSEEILERQRRYVQYFSRCSNVLDIGCGRGEFLDLLRESDIGGYGVDVQEDMVLFCRKKGLRVVKASAVSHLASIEDKALDGVFMAQVAEHLVPSDLIALIGSAYRAMKFGTHLVIETINPSCVYALVKTFYLDLSHVKPVHPQTLAFLLESNGFRDVAVEYLTPVSPEFSLEKLEESRLSSEELKAFVGTYNSAVDKLNSLLYTHQEYAIVARK